MSLYSKFPSMYILYYNIIYMNVPVNNTSDVVCVKKTDEEIRVDVYKKLLCLEELIQKTVLHVQLNKKREIITTQEMLSCVNKLEEIEHKIQDIFIGVKEEPIHVIIQKTQQVVNELSEIIRIYGTYHLEDLLSICLSCYHSQETSPILHDKLLLAKKYFHPTSYKVITVNEKEREKGLEKANDLKHLDCTDISHISKKYYLKVYGIQLYIEEKKDKNNHPTLKKGLYIYGYLENIPIYFFKTSNQFIQNQLSVIQSYLPTQQEFKQLSFSRYLNILELKDFFINQHYTQYYHNYIGYLNNLKLVKQSPLSDIVKKFIQYDLFLKRNFFLQLLIQGDQPENIQLGFLLYDMLSVDTADHVDSSEQTLLFDTLPLSIQPYFKNVIQNSMTFTLSVDMNKISLDQQIALLNVNDIVKDKAMTKLKEIRSRSEDSGFKAKQYLEGLVKIPFGIYKKEPIFYKMDLIKTKFNELISTPLLEQNKAQTHNSPKITNIDILLHIESIKKTMKEQLLNYLGKRIEKDNKQGLIQLIHLFNNHFNANLSIQSYSSSKKGTLQIQLKEYLETYHQHISIENILSILFKITLENIWVKECDKAIFIINQIEKEFYEIKNYLKGIRQHLDASVFGHDKAKKQIERIFGQWINGQQTGHVFGFEGLPGIGKTSLAKKGLASCLTDKEGNSRPFAMIQIGGESNGSTLQGHNYTYVGSTWGSIVQILMDTKCMNPIIFIDELDKVSKTENGKDIIGILTHMLDSTQNEGFQDKYFNGIDIDLSKALIILSYNDSENIDKILLDRIHRIPFDALTNEDKITICQQHLLPELFKKVGLENILVFSFDVLMFIIENYTLEPGVRKLKELLFDIVAEINLNLLQGKYSLKEYTTNQIVLTENEIETIYLKDKRKILVKKIHSKSQVGRINCLWANSMGQGGILSANAKIVPSSRFLDLKLTGLLDDMMKESLNISLTIAYDLLGEKEKQALFDKYDQKECKYGIHIHMGEGSVQKSGTSAGIAISLLIYSILTQRKIKPDFAVTGEAGDLMGASHEIGGLSIKFLSGIKAGVKHFIFPEENKKDYDDFILKYGDKSIVQGIQFTAIHNIQEAIDIIMEESNL